MNEIAPEMLVGGTVVAVTADAGLGLSTTLEQAARDAARRGTRVLRAAGHADERDLPGAGLHQVLQPLGPTLREVPAADRGAALAALTLSRTADAERVFAQGARALLTALTRRGPVLVVVDDAHLLDKLSAGVLRELLARPIENVAYLVGVRRRHAARLLPPGTATVPLEPLPQSAAAARLARHRLAPRGRGRLEILRRASGKPRAIAELAAAFDGATTAEILALPLPFTLPLQQRYASRLTALTPAARRLARLVSAMTGDESTAEVEAAHGIRFRGENLDLVALLDDGLLEESDGRLRFADPLAAIATYTATPAADRADLHARFASVLEPGSLAHARHRAAAATAPSEEIAAALQSAALNNSADPEVGPHEAAGALQRAAELSPRPIDAGRRYAAALEQAARLGQTTWVHELWTAVVAQNEPGLLVAGTAHQAALALSRLGRQREAMDTLTESARRCPPATRYQALLLASTAAHLARVSGLPEHRVTVAGLERGIDRLPERPSSPAGPGRSPLRSDDVAALRAAIAGVTGNAPPTLPALSLAASAPSIAPAEPDPPTAARALLLAYAADVEPDPVAARRLRERALATVRASGDAAAAPEVYGPISIGLADESRWDDAADLRQEIRDLCAEADLPVLELENAVLTANGLALRGQVEAARALADPVWRRIDLYQNGRIDFLLGMTTGNIAFAEGNYASAYRHYRRLFGADDRPPPADSWGYALLGLISIAPRAGQVPDALRLLEAYGRPRSLRLRLLVHQARAQFVDDADTETNFRRAVEPPVGEAWALDRGLARLHYGSWLRRHRRPLDARAQLVRAVQRFEGMGTSVLGGLAEAELRAAGEGAAGPDERAEGADSTDSTDSTEGTELLDRLTPQQRQIVLLAAQGMRNGEIATQLLLSPRTVGTHLYNAYPKLGVESRRELSDLLEPGGRSA